MRTVAYNIMYLITRQISRNMHYSITEGYRASSGLLEFYVTDYGTS